MEIELRRGTENLHTLRENLYLTFDQSEYPSVDDALELVRMKIVEDPSSICTQPDWIAQIENVGECYNFTIDEDDDPRNINIPKSKGSCVVVGPTLECPEITEKLKIKKLTLEQNKHRRLHP